MPNKNNNNRMGRIGEEYKKELSQIIDRELKDPSITGMISVTIDGLKKSAGFIRTELAKRVNLRNTPELIFEKDDSIEYGAKIDSILKDIMPKS